MKKNYITRGDALSVLKTIADETFDGGIATA